MTMRSFCLLFAFFFALVRPAVAGDPLDNVVKLDVLAGWTLSDGTQMAALRLSMEPGWKTYWRAPGDAGIPPQFDWRGSRNLAGMQIEWPTPEVFDQNGLRSVGYKDQLVIPLRIMRSTQSDDVRLKGRLEIGVCKDICIPRELRFDVTLPPAPSTPDAIITAALANVPYSEKEAGVTSATCTLTPKEDGIRIDAVLTLPSTGGSEFVVIETGNPEIWSAEASASRSGGTLNVRGFLAHISGESFALNRSDIRLTVLGKKHAVDIRGCSAG